ncbi:uncharacterized protein [Miscanthus floridulus]|uniref:uncharacterized protein n=1 Tax=Miscanthus floridulus TaxID=154761 RepID=UPI0034594A29
MAMTGGSELGDSSGTAVAAQPREEVVVRTVREVSGTSWPTLTRTNYGEWSMTMKVKLRARRLWNAVDKGADNEENDMSALEAILAAVPAEYRKSLGEKSSAKEAWEAIAAMRVSSDHAKKTMAQLLKQEYALLKFKDGHLRAVDERLEQAIATTDSGKLLLTEEEWAARRNFGKAASSSCGGKGKHRDRASSEKKQVDPNACRRCGKMGHWAQECPNRKREKKAEAHLARADDEDDATILMAIIISIGQLDERGSEVLIKDGVLRIRDWEQRLLAKVKRSLNQLYLLDLKVEQSVCLAARHSEEPWMWHARFRHLSFDALGRLEKMVRGLPHIKHGGELCDSCLAGK